MYFTDSKVEKRQTQAPMSTVSLTNEARIYNGEKTASSISGSGRTGQSGLRCSVNPTLCDPMDYILPGSSVHGIPDQGVESCITTSPVSPAWQEDFLLLSHWGSPGKLDSAL